MNYWWDTRAYQQSNKISPFAATVAVPQALVMIASMSTRERIYVDHGLAGRTATDRGSG